jgi:hypothetical protein
MHNHNSFWEQAANRIILGQQLAIEFGVFRLCKSADCTRMAHEQACRFPKFTEAVTLRKAQGRAWCPMVELSNVAQRSRRCLAAAIRLVYRLYLGLSTEASAKHPQPIDRQTAPTLMRIFKA